MGCFDSCLRCLSLVPWASLIAAVLCWAGTALFCGTAHEAVSNSYILLNSTDFYWNETSTDTIIQNFKYSIYGIAAFMFVLSILLFVDGILSTRVVKSDYEEGCKTSCCGLCIGIFYTMLVYICGVGWLLITCFAAFPIHFFIVANSQCKANTCIDFRQTGILPAHLPDDIGRICGDDLTKFCSTPTFNVTYQLYIVAFAGAAITLLSMKQFLMCLSANFAYLKMTKKLAVYEDTKYREEMELNDIINTARSNERLTYKY
nr:neuronal membrane glycoprotein M6-a [Ciona intestinalis]|eukprot:XP_002128797.1 neuronal membrane glycoprotein M6-a [Ciona intestinalis]